MPLEPKKLLLCYSVQNRHGAWRCARNPFVSTPGLFPAPAQWSETTARRTRQPANPNYFQIITPLTIPSLSAVSSSIRAGQSSLTWASHRTSEVILFRLITIIILFSPVCNTIFDNTKSYRRNKIVSCGILSLRLLFPVQENHVGRNHDHIRRAYRPQVFLTTGSFSDRYAPSPGNSASWLVPLHSKISTVPAPLSGGFRCPRPTRLQR